MFNKFELMIAWRYLRSQKNNGFLSVISGFSLFGIAIGVAALIIVMSVMNGFKKDMSEKIIGFNGEIAISSFKGDLSDYSSLVQIVDKVPDVDFAYPVIEKQLLISYKDASSGAIIKSLDKKDLLKKKIISQNIISGSLNDFGDEESNILVGYELANKLNATIGSEIRFISPENSFKSLIGSIPRTKLYKIVGIFNSGMYQFDSSNIIMSLEAAQNFFDMEEVVSFIEVKINHPLKSKKIMADLEKTFGLRYRINDWQMANKGFFQILETERTTMFCILSLIILVASFNIISSLIMLVRDKVSDIAILRSLGVNRGSIMRVFLYTGFMIGLMGTILGLAVGVSLAYNLENIKTYLGKIKWTRFFEPILHYLSNLPADLDWVNVTLIGIFALILSFLVTLYPSYQAAKLDPAQGIKL